MSTIRELINEINTEGTNYLVPAIEDHLRADVVAGSLTVTVLDAQETAIVFFDGAAIGILTVNYEEPCLVFEGLVRYD